MAKPKFDYDGEEFYDEIRRLAMQGQKDSEIAYSLADKFGVDLVPDSFGRMKHGNYTGWSEEQNKIRSEKVCRALARGREQINSLVRARYLKTAIGGVKVKGTTTVKRHMIINGERTDDMVVEVRETEQETPPNIQALATWLYHFDDDWRAMQQGKKEDEKGNIPFDPKKGVSIHAWIEREKEQEASEEEES